jgi:hypothetical protein
LSRGGLNPKEDGGMKRRTILFLTIGTAICIAASAPVQTPLNIREHVAATFVKLVDADNDWRAAQAASDELATLGEPALDVLCDAAEHHENARVRTACYELLTTAFAHDDQAIGTITNHGLSDSEDRIRYICAFRLGELKVYAAHQRLRNVFADPASAEFTRLAAAKSLAQLGEADVLPALYEAVGSDWYMPRSMGNLGLKVLTGKDVNEFDGYDFSEGAFVSGGHEAVGAFDAVEHAEKRATRHQAIASYFRWLKAERPELYKHVAPGR